MDTQAHETRPSLLYLCWHWRMQEPSQASSQQRPWVPRIAPSHLPDFQESPLDPLPHSEAPVPQADSTRQRLLWPVMMPLGTSWRSGGGQAATAQRHTGSPQFWLGLVGRLGGLGNGCILSSEPGLPQGGMQAVGPSEPCVLPGSKALDHFPRSTEGVAFGSIRWIPGSGHAGSVIPLFCPCHVPASPSMRHIPAQRHRASGSGFVRWHLASGP